MLMSQFEPYPWELPSPKRNEDPTYVFFRDSVHTWANVPERKLFYLWWMHKDFRKLWFRQVGKKTQLAEEKALLLRCILFGLNRDEATAVIQAWWYWHDIPAEAMDLQILSLHTYSVARKFAQPILEEYERRNAQERNERLLQKTRSQIYDVLFSGAMTARQIATELGTSYESTRKQLQRMTDQGLLKRVKRGLYAIAAEEEQVPEPQALAAPTSTVEGHLQRQETPDPEFADWEAEIRRYYPEYFEELSDDLEDIPETSEILEVPISQAKLPF